MKERKLSREARAILLTGLARGFEFKYRVIPHRIVVQLNINNLLSLKFRIILHCFAEKWVIFWVIYFLSLH